MLNFTKIRRVFLICFLFTVFGMSCSTESRLRHYSGDGEIKAKPSYGLLGGGGGYMVQFKPMKFDRPTHIDYHFAGLPHWNAGIYLAVEDPRIWEDRRQYEKNRRHDSTTACWDDLTATCSMVLKDANGNVVLQFNKKLSELTWSRVGQGPWELYDQGAINFKPDNRRYILEVNIDPEPLLKNDVGYILIRGGGHETVSVGF